MKKSAESNFRKIRLAYEGPKQKSRAKAKLPAENNDLNGEIENNILEKKFVPTVSKAEFVSSCDGDSLYLFPSRFL